VQFDPLWPREYAQSLLLRGIPRAVFMSATLRPQLFGYIGIEELQFFDYPSSFPVSNRPVYVLPYNKVQWNMTPQAFTENVRGLDAVLGGERADRKALVSSVSYEYARRIVRASGQARRMISCDKSEDTPELVREFKRSKLPLIAVHPNLYQGHDFPGPLLENNILFKLPFTDGRDPLNSARRKSDKTFSHFSTMSYVQQWAGRGVRYGERERPKESDRCENWVLDGHAGWFLDTSGKVGTYVRDYASGWFAESVKRVGYLPRAPRAMLGS
jgi:Rad3-related DNA helicase